ncbi:hypothetical protein CRUP_019804, partial [Coryphaenoides rupestris]
MTSTDGVTVMDAADTESEKMPLSTELSENNTEAAAAGGGGYYQENSCHPLAPYMVLSEKMPLSTELSENNTEQQQQEEEDTTKSCGEDLAEQVVPCAEAIEEEAKENVPRTAALLTERESEDNKSETPTEEKREEEVSTEEKQVEKEAEEKKEKEQGEECDGGGGGDDPDEEEPEKQPQTAPRKKAQSRQEKKLQARQGKKKAASHDPKDEKPSMMNLNNQVVLMRKEVGRVRALLIRKLTRQIAALKKRKGNETEVQKNQRRAARMVEEIHEMKALKPDVVTKIALQQEIVFDVVCKNPASTVTDRAVARIASHPQFNKRIGAIKLAVKAFREERMNSGSKKTGDKAAEKGKPKPADAVELRQRKGMEEEEEEEEGEEQETGDSEEEDEEEEDGDDSEDNEVKQTTAEVTTTRNRDLSGVLASCKIGNVLESSKKGMLRNTKPTGLLKNTLQSKEMKKRPNRPTAPEKTGHIEDDVRESGLEKSKEDRVTESLPSEGATEELLHKGSPLSESDLKVHQGGEEEEEEEEEESDLESDEQEESDSSAEVPMRSPDSENDEVSSEVSEVCASTKYSEAKDLKKSLSKVGDRSPNLKPERDDDDEDDESDLESSDEEEAKEYFDDSTEERFHKRSSQSESESDDDFFLGKVSKFKKKKERGGGGTSTKSEAKGNPPEPEGTSELEPGPSDSQGSKFTSLFCPSLSRSERGGGGGEQRFGGRGGRGG